MAYKTYRARLVVEGNHHFENEQALTTADQPYAEHQYRSLLSIYNRAGSGKVIRIDDLQWIGYTRGAENNRHYLYRQSSTAYSAGPSNTRSVQVKALDDQSASLNANVDVVYNDANYSGSGTQLFAFFHYSQLFSSKLAGASFGTISPMVRKSELMFHADANVQPYVIREGETFVLGVWSSFLMADRCAVTFRHAGVVYEANFWPEKLIPRLTANESMRFAIRNLTGSGSTVEILSIEVIDELSNQSTPAVTSYINLIDDQSEGEAVPTITYDSANGALSSSIEVKTGALTLRGGAKKGAWVSRPYVSRHTTLAQWAYPDASWIGFPNIARNFPTSLDKELILREGEGIAIVPIFPSLRYTGEWLAMFSVDNVASNTYSRGRVVNA